MVVRISQHGIAREEFYKTKEMVFQLVVATDNSIVYGLIPRRTIFELFNFETIISVGTVCDQIVGWLKHCNISLSIEAHLKRLRDSLVRRRSGPLELFCGFPAAGTMQSQLHITIACRHAANHTVHCCNYMIIVATLISSSSDIISPVSG